MIEERFGHDALRGEGLPGAGCPLQPLFYPATYLCSDLTGFLTGGNSFDTGRSELTRLSQ